MWSTCSSEASPHGHTALNGRRSMSTASRSRAGANLDRLAAAMRDLHARDCGQPVLTVYVVKRLAPCSSRMALNNPDQCLHGHEAGDQGSVRPPTPAAIMVWPPAWLASDQHILQRHVARGSDARLAAGYGRAEGERPFEEPPLGTNPALRPDRHLGEPPRPAESRP